MINLAADCENKPNQAYLLLVLLTIAKQLKPKNKSGLAAGEKGSDYDQDETERTTQNMFDTNLPQNAQTLKFLSLVHETNLMNYLVMMIGSDDIERYENQYEVVRKFG